MSKGKFGATSTNHLGSYSNKKDTVMLKPSMWQKQHQCSANSLINRCMRMRLSTLYGVLVKDISVHFIIIVGNEYTFIQQPVFPKDAFNGW